jgi:hypothetical protein
MLRFLTPLALTLAIAPALAAQEKPAPAVQQAYSGKWNFDQSRSDTVSGDPMAGMRGGAIGGGSGRGGSGGGGGGGRQRGGGGGGGGATTPPPVDSNAQQQPAGGRGRDPRLAAVMADMNPGAGMVLGVNDSVVAIATATMLKANPSAQSNWKTDGKKHQDAQMDGTIVEMQSGWKDGVLSIMYGVVGVGSLTREFRITKDGKTLEMKEIIEVNGRKAEKKLVFNRG